MHTGPEGAANRPQRHRWFDHLCREFHGESRGSITMRTRRSLDVSTILCPLYFGVSCLFALRAICTITPPTQSIHATICSIATLSLSPRSRIQSALQPTERPSTVPRSAVSSLCPSSVSRQDGGWARCQRMETGRAGDGGPRRVALPRGPLGARGACRPRGAAYRGVDPNVAGVQEPSTCGEGR